MDDHPAVFIGGQEIAYTEGTISRLTNPIRDELFVMLVLPTGRGLTYRCPMQHVYPIYQDGGQRLHSLHLSHGEGMLARMERE